MRLITRETVEIETPAKRDTSFIVATTISLSIFFQCRTAQSVSYRCALIQNAGVVRPTPTEFNAIVHHLTWM